MLRICFKSKKTTLTIRVIYLYFRDFLLKTYQGLVSIRRTKKKNIYIN